MKHSLSFFISIVCTAYGLRTCPAIAQTGKLLVTATENYNSQVNAAALLFTENKGQVADAKGNLHPEIFFTAHSNGAKIFVTASGIHYQFEKKIFPEGYKGFKQKVQDYQKQVALGKQMRTETQRFTLSLEGANASPDIIKKDENAYTENFYLAHCPSGITGVHTYSKIIMENVYPGIDWVIYSKKAGLEYDFIVHPGADPSLIKLKVSNPEDVQIAKDGSLVMATTLGEVKEAAPVSYCNGIRVTTKFRKGKDGTISFAIAAWDKSKPLIVDPSVSWATYYGGTADDFGYSATIDGSGNAYLAGLTTSSSGIASGGFQNTYGGSFDAFLVKFSSTGVRLWATYYGGGGDDIGYFCTTDGSGNVYLAGGTSSTSGIASGGFQNTYGGSDVDGFLAKFSSTGTRLWATYYGSTGSDVGYGCTVDGSGNVYFGGETDSPSGIASGGFQNTYGGTNDAFLVKFSSAGARLWATYYGGTSSEEGYSLIVDASGNVFLSGDTQSASGIASGGFQNTYGGTYDGFLVKFSSTGARLWATYYGGNTYDDVYSCATDASGNVYLAGETESASGIASGGFQNTFGGDTDGFLVKFSSTGARLWATYYGATGSDAGQACTVDGLGNVYLAGATASAAGIASGGFQNTFSGITDGFLVKFNSTGSRLWASYYGGTGEDQCTFCKSDASGNIFMPGYTTSASGIASGGFQNVLGGSGDAFLAKINGDNPVPVKLISFTAQKDGMARNRIQWRTVMETVKAKFEVEHSANGYLFMSMVSIAGRSETGASYSVFDNNPFSVVSYYRLKTTELDGTITFSNIIAVRSDGKDMVTVAPVPAKMMVTITNTNTLLNGTKAVITDMQGREVHRFTVAGAAIISVSGWASGVYYLRLSDGSAIRLMKE